MFIWFGLGRGIKLLKKTQKHRKSPRVTLCVKWKYKMLKAVEDLRCESVSGQVWELLWVLKMTEKDLLSTQLVVLVRRLVSKQFTYHANQTYILGLTINTEESFYTGAMVKQSGVLQTALTARVDMLWLCERIPVSSKNYKGDGMSQAECMALFTEKHSENLANIKTLSEKALEL